MKKIAAIFSLVLLSGCASNPEMAAVVASALAVPGETSSDIMGSSSLVQNDNANNGNKVMSQDQPFQCQDIDFEQAQELLRNGYSYLDPEGDGVACMALNGKATSAAEPTSTVAPVIVAAPTPDPDLTSAAKYVSRSSKKAIRSNTSSGGGSNCTWVDGYTRKNGTKVRGHRRCG